MIPASFICMVFPIFDTPTFKTLGDSHERGARSLGHWRRDPNTPSLLHKNRRIFRACAGEKSQKARKQHAKRQGKPADRLPPEAVEATPAAGAPPEAVEATPAAGAPPEPMEATPADSHAAGGSGSHSGSWSAAGAGGSISARIVAAMRYIM